MRATRATLYNKHTRSLGSSSDFLYPQLARTTQDCLLQVPGPQKEVNHAPQGLSQEPNKLLVYSRGFKISVIVMIAKGLLKLLQKVLMTVDNNPPKHLRNPKP